MNKFTENGIRYKEDSGVLTVVGTTDAFSDVKLIIPSQVHGFFVNNIAPMAFASCNIEEAHIPASISRIGAMAFANCINLKTVTITTVKNYNSNTPLSIADSAFTNCLNLISFEGTEKTVCLAINAFYGCWCLKEASFVIGTCEENAFKDCSQLETLEFDTLSVLQDNCLFDCSVKTLNFRGECMMPASVVDFIKSNNIKVVCSSKSNIVNLAYEGVNVEISAWLEILGDDWLA